MAGSGICTFLEGGVAIYQLMYKQLIGNFIISTREKGHFRDDINSTASAGILIAFLIPLSYLYEHCYILSDPQIT